MELLLMKLRSSLCKLSSDLISKDKVLYSEKDRVSPSDVIETLIESVVVRVDPLTTD